MERYSLSVSLPFSVPLLTFIAIRAAATPATRLPKSSTSPKGPKITSGTTSTGEIDVPCHALDAANQLETMLICQH